MSFRLAFYGDDFTGSTDAMEALSMGGVPCVLVLEPLTLEVIKERFPQAEAIGLAGTSRSMKVSEMNESLPKHLAYLKTLEPDFVHYKTCSTFDSSPDIGSIGRAVEIGLELFKATPVPMVVGAPVLKRYVIFANLFATAQGQTYRLDRHPTMSLHPVTPMGESDLRRHLAKQTSLRIELYDLHALEQARPLPQHADILLFDTLNQEHLKRIGKLLCEQKYPYWVGSSGMEYALIAHLQASGEVQARVFQQVQAVKQILVMSGSAAPATASQINWAKANGFNCVRLDSLKMIDENQADAYLKDVLAKAEQVLNEGESLLLYSAKGPRDPMIQKTKDRLASMGLHPNQASSLLGKQQGYLLKTLLERHSVKRVCVSGGDTCGHAIQELGLTALELLMPIAPGSPLCKAHAKTAALNGLEIALKAGQMGQEDYFASVLSGQPPTT